MVIFKFFVRLAQGHKNFGTGCDSPIFYEGGTGVAFILPPYKVIEFIKEIDLEVVQMSQKGREDCMPLAMTTLFGNVKLLSNFCILQNILDRDLYMRILL